MCAESSGLGRICLSVQLLRNAPFQNWVSGVGWSEFGGVRGGGNLEALDGAKKASIVDAAVRYFGKYGYKGAHTADIARAAGMSKSALFFYFRNKRSLYEYVVDVVYEKAVEWVIDDGFWQRDDFFDRMLYLVESKRGIIDEHPYLLAFSLKAFYPTHRDVKGSMGRYNYAKADEMVERFFSGVDLARFKEGISLQHIASMMVWLADGWMHQRIALGQPVDMDLLLEEFRGWCSMLRFYAYREECL